MAAFLLLYCTMYTTLYCSVTVVSLVVSCSWFRMLLDTHSYFVTAIVYLPLPPQPLSRVVAGDTVMPELESFLSLLTKLLMELILTCFSARHMLHDLGDQVLLPLLPCFPVSSDFVGSFLDDVDQHFKGLLWIVDQ